MSISHQQQATLAEAFDKFNIALAKEPEEVEDGFLDHIIDLFTDKKGTEKEIIEECVPDQFTVKCLKKLQISVSGYNLITERSDHLYKLGNKIIVPGMLWITKTENIFIVIYYIFFVLVRGAVETDRAVFVVLPASKVSLTEKLIGLFREMEIFGK